ncbi:MAG: selenoprotein O, partial [Alphaproteobacteria bacterium]
AYGRQPEASLWAVCRLADCLVPFGGTEPLEKVLADFYPRLEMRLQQNLCWRLGVEASEETGKHLVRSLFEAARGSETPFAQIIHDWYGGKQRRGHYDGAGWQEFAGHLAATTPLPQATDPWFEREEAVWLPIELVESLWEPIAAHDDWAPLYAKIDEIRELGVRLRGEAG